ncbi:large ribosomal subunit protein uL29m [Culicoides brevitarsis]|uniref:large ribosomal subunit protein uL29m n=1 Tax=Culicoides brevitarsis TaxID=469753 RepID=UPI00307BC6EF
MSFLLRNIRSPINQINSLFKSSLTSGALNQNIARFHISPANQKLLDFFDDNKNWGENEVKHGRAWLKPELRIKSNADLHKLWYILLKERNMLMTMEHECDRLGRFFPSPERRDKVKISMENLESVIQERNKAYYELEVGEPVYIRENQEISTELGVTAEYLTKEHTIEKAQNEEWKKGRRFHGSHAVSKFLRYYREKYVLEKYRAKNRDRNEVIKLLNRFPNIDRNLLRERFNVDVDKIIKQNAARGHHIQKVESIDN